MERTIPLDDQRGHGLLELGGLVLALAGGGALLYGWAGPPHPPAELPTWPTLVATLRSSEVPLEAFAYLFTTAAWLVWGWTVGSLLLHGLVAASEALACGAAWAGALRRFSERVSVPIVRRVVDRAIVAVVVVHLLARPVGVGADGPAAPVAAAVVPAHPAGPAQPDAARAADRSVRYTVQPGDTLWTIAERFYGLGEEFPRLVTANAGHTMPDGRVFTRAGVIHPGWVLAVPLPSTALDRVDGHDVYVVERGDTLRGIAARFLGDERAWPTIFEPNHGVARLPDGRTLTDPDLIWPELRLRMPGGPAPNGTAMARSPDREDETLRRPATPPPIASPQPPAVAAPTPPAVPTPRVASPSAPASPTPVVPTPVANRAFVVEPEAPPPPPDSGPSTLAYGAAGLAAAALIGGAGVVAVRRARRSLSEPPVPRGERPAPNDEFAQTGLARALAHRLEGGDAEPATLVARHARRFLDERGFVHVAIVLVRHGRGGAALMLRCPEPDQERVLDLAEAFAARVGGRGRAWLTPDRDVMLEVARPTLLGMVVPPADRGGDDPWLVPVGVLANGDTLHANWRALGHAVVVGLPGGGTDVILTSLLGGLAARCRPDELQLWTIASRYSLSPGLAELPHQRAGVVDPADAAGVASLLTTLRAELNRRTWRAEDPEEGDPDGPDPELLLVVGDLAELDVDPATLDRIGADGAAHGLRLLVGTTRPVGTSFDPMPYCQTRVILQTLDADQSIQLLGQPDGADLGAGDVLVSLEGRLPIPARGLRIADEHLTELVHLAGEAYRHRTTDVPAPEAAPAPDEPADPYDPAPGAVEDMAAAAPEADPDAGVGGETEAPATRDEPATAPLDVEGDAPPDQPAEPALAIPAQLDDGREPRLFVATNGANGHARVALDELGVLAADAGAGEVSNGATASNGHDPAGGETDAPPLLEVRCLGTFVVRSGAQEVRPSGEDSAHYKPWEILAMLAAFPGGAVNQAVMLPALWPDGDDDHGLNRLKVTLNRLRALLQSQVPTLPAGAIQQRGGRGGVCRIDTRLVWSDAHAFLRLCRSAGHLPDEEAIAVLQEARALYVGDLLTSHAARFYAWVHERYGGQPTLHEVYRAEYDRATMRVARYFVERGQPELAVPLYRELLKVEPTLEDVVRELYRCHARLGDAGALVREERQLRLALREAFGDPDDPHGGEPSPETTALFRQLRMDLDARLPAVKIARRKRKPPSRVHTAG